MRRVDALAAQKAAPNVLGERGHSVPNYHFNMTSGNVQIIVFSSCFIFVIAWIAMTALL
jgi:hypothetical protein